MLSDKSAFYSYRTSEFPYKKYCIRIFPGAEGKRRQKVYQGETRHVLRLNQMVGKMTRKKQKPEHFLT